MPRARARVKPPKSPATPPAPPAGPRKVMVYLYPAALADLARLAADESRGTGRPAARLASVVIAQSLRREVRRRGLDADERDRDREPSP